MSNVIARTIRRHDPRRSNLWGKVRAAHLIKEPSCQACGGTEALEVHHIAPFHLHPELELSEDNLITLCEKNGHDCHFVFGHFHDWKLFNPNVRAMVAEYRTASENAHK